MRGWSGVPATVHPDHLARYVARLVTDEERARGGDVLRATRPPYRRDAGMVLDAFADAPLRLRGPEHRRVDEPRRDRVDGDPLRAELERQRLGETDDARLRSDVGRHVRLPALCGRRGDVDDAAPPGIEHVGHDRLATEERAGEVDRQRAV